ncbi:hypothetical protein GX51_08091 [Blastomyces parvus]|uniref:Uncharacterized protein n=1 Tax=Blastomyces parvus TaxID=2060905 RepID=A0A2B7WGX5_9EURO|nr:hypothetical protein GX51_08091 [Blastomyces parvus]
MIPPKHEEYQIGWICALPIEAAAAQEMLDEKFGTLGEQDSADPNVYTLGRIGRHYIVIACLGGQYGTTSATTVAINMKRTFSKSLRFGLVVGIGQGIPSTETDIRLGDIVISYPTDTCGGVLQYDMGKIREGGKLIRTGSLNSPPRSLLAAVDQMRAAAFREDPLYPSYLQKAIQRNARTRRNFSRPHSKYDRLFRTQFEHPPGAASCDSCLAEWEIERDECVDEEQEPQTHFGIIASGNALIEHGETRERLRADTSALCFDMEAAGLMQDFPCLVIRGICDYADSHKNEQWQGYAALAAASYTKELLGYVPCALAGEVESLGKSTNYIGQRMDLHGWKIVDGAAFDSYENQHDECRPGTRIELLRDIEDWVASPRRKCILWLNDRNDVIVIDALNECEPRENKANIYYIRAILQLLPQVHTSISIRLRFFLTSRSETPVQLGLKDIAGDHHNLDLNEVPKLEIEHDISLFLECRLSRIWSYSSTGLENIILRHLFQCQLHYLSLLPPHAVFLMMVNGNLRRVSQNSFTMLADSFLKINRWLILRFFNSIHRHLMFSPRNSITRGNFNNELSKNRYQLLEVENVWSVELQTLKSNSNKVHSVTSLDDQVLAFGSGDMTINLSSSGISIQRQSLRAHSSRDRSGSFSPDGQLLAAECCGKIIKLWDLSTGNLQQTLEGHSKWVWSEINVGLSILEEKWLCFRHERILWLPTEYRPARMAFRGEGRLYIVIKLFVGLY